MKYFKIIIILFCFYLILTGYADAKEEKMPKQVKVGPYELNLLWQKDFDNFDKVDGLKICPGSYGRLNPAVSISNNGEFITIDGRLCGGGKKEPTSNGILYLLNKKGKILWSKRKGIKQTGTVSKNGKTVLLMVPRDELDIEFFVYNINGNELGRNRQPSWVTISGNGEYILAWGAMAGYNATLYNKKGEMVWQYQLKNQWGGNAQILDTGDVILFDTGDALLKRPDGQVLWRWEVPSNTLYFYVPPDATANDPHLLLEEKNPEDKILFVNAKGEVLWEATQTMQGCALSRKANLVVGQSWWARGNSIWIYNTKTGKRIFYQPVKTQSHMVHITPDGGLFILDGMEWSRSQGLSGWEFDEQLLLIDTGDFKRTKIPSGECVVSPDGKYLAIIYYGKLYLYSIEKK